MKVIRLMPALLFVALAWMRYEVDEAPKPMSVALGELSVRELQLLPRIGPVLAERLQGRQIARFEEVHGIGTMTSARLESYIRLENP